MNAKDLRKRRVREKIKNDQGSPRLSVHATLSHTYAQIIDDASGKTLCAASDLKVTDKKTKVEKASKVGEDIATLALKAGIKKVVFDRGSKLYHGRVKALAEEARKKGLVF